MPLQHGQKNTFFFLSFNEQQGDSGVFSSFFYPLSHSLSRFPSQWLSHCSWTMILMRSQLSLFHQSERKGQRKRSGVCVWGIAYFGLPIGTWRVEWRGPAWWLTRTKPTEPQSHPNNIHWWYMVPSKHLRTRTKKKNCACTDPNLVLHIFGQISPVPLDLLIRTSLMEPDPLLMDEDKDNEDPSLGSLSSFRLSSASRKKCDLTNRTQRFFYVTCPFLYYPLCVLLDWQRQSESPIRIISPYKQAKNVSTDNFSPRQFFTPSLLVCCCFVVRLSAH